MPDIFVKISELVSVAGKQLSDEIPFAGADPFNTYSYTIKTLLNLGMTGLTGGGTANLDGVPTTKEAVGQMWNVVAAGNLYSPYQLQQSVIAQILPNVIHPLDFDAGNNPKIFQLIGFKGTKFVTTGISGDGYFELINQSGAPSTPSSAARQYSDASGRPSWIQTDGFTRTWSSSLSASKVYTLPDASGTVALTATTIPSIAGSTNVLVNGLTAPVAGTAITLSLPTILASINSVTSAAGQNLVLAVGTGGTVLTLTNSTLAATFAGTVTSTGSFLSSGSTGLLGLVGTNNYVQVSTTNHIWVTGGFTAVTLTQAGLVSFSNVTDSVSSITGAVAIAGGLGVAGSTYIGGGINGASALTIGTSGSVVGVINFKNATSGTATLAPPTGALSAYQVTLPNAASVLPIFSQQITVTGPTTARTWAVPDSALTITVAAATVLDDITVSAMVDTLGGASSGGTGGLARLNSPAFITPNIGAAIATTINGLAITASNKTLTISNTITLAATADGNTLNIGSGGTLGSAAFTPSTTYEVPLSFTTGLTRTINTVTVNTTQNIAKLSNLTTNGFIKTISSDGTLSIDTATYLTSSTGVSSITGTPNQVNVSASTGAITISTPQSIGTTSSPTFNGLSIALTTSSTVGVIKIGTDSFIHTYGDPTSNGANTFVGRFSGNFTMGPGGGSATLASGNTMLGFGTYGANTTGYQNVGIGWGVLNANTTGYTNVAVGYNSQNLGTTAYGNSSLGNYGLAVNLTGNLNVAVGEGALRYKTSGDEVVAIGHGTGVYDLTSNRGTWIGGGSPGPGNNTPVNDTIAIGYNAVVTASNQAVIGNANIYDVYLGTASATANLHAQCGTFTSPSGTLPPLTLVNGASGDQYYSEWGTGGALFARWKRSQSGIFTNSVELMTRVGFGIDMNSLGDVNGSFVIADNGTARLTMTSAGALQINGTVGFNSTTPIAKPTVTGSRGANAALASVLTALANYGLITDSSS